MKPAGYFKQFRTPIKIIKNCLNKRIENNRFPRGMSRNTQHYWFANLKRNIKGCLGENYQNRLMDGFQKLIEMNVIPVSCPARSLGETGL